MNAKRFCLVFLLTLALPFASRAADAEKAPGYFDFDDLPISGKGEYVDINLSSSLLSLAGRIACDGDPETAAILKGLKQVRVSVVNLDSDNKEKAASQVEAVRRKLANAGWEQAVNVRESSGETVNIHVKTGSGETIEGLVVTAFEPGDEAVLVNIVGSVRIDQLAKIAARLDIEPLKKLKVNFAMTDKSAKH